MASVSKDKHGWRVKYSDAHKKVRYIRIGKATKSQANSVKDHIDKLAKAQISGSTPEEATLRWTTKIGDQLHSKLVANGLVQDRHNGTLEAFIDRYTKIRTDVKKSAKLLYGQTKTNLVDYFGKDKPLRDVTDGDAEEFYLWMKGTGLASATISRRMRCASQFFRFAVQKRVIESNPFDNGDLKAKLKLISQSNSARFHNVTREETAKLIEAAPDSQWRLLIALARFGGLRTPSEPLELTWDDIDWANDRITVTSPKTERYEGKGTRTIPLFPELRPHLLEAAEAAEVGEKYVITRYRDAGQNLRTQLLRIIKQAGLKAWEKPWQNMRASREIELCNDYPMHVACEWIGHSQLVAMTNYLQVTDEHFDAAIHSDTHSDGHSEMAPIPAPHTVPSGRTSSCAELGGHSNTATCDDAGPGESEKVRLRGVLTEPVNRLRGNDLGNQSEETGTYTGTLQAKIRHSGDVSVVLEDRQLEQLIARWPLLTESTRRAIVELAESSGMIAAQPVEDLR